MVKYLVTFIARRWLPPYRYKQNSKKKICHIVTISSPIISYYFLGISLLILSWISLLVLSVISCLPPSILSRKHPLFISKAKPKDYKPWWFCKREVVMEDSSSSSSSSSLSLLKLPSRSCSVWSPFSPLWTESIEWEKQPQRLFSHGWVSSSVEANWVGCFDEFIMNVGI